MAKQGDTGRFGIDWRVLDTYPSFDSGVRPAEDHAAFVAAREGQAAAVARTGAGTGYDVDSLTEVFIGLLAPVGVFGSRVVTGEVLQTEELPTWTPPYGGARSTEISLEGSSGGWGVAAATYWPGNGGGSYEVAATGGGHTVQGDGITASTPLAITGLVVQPLAFATARGDDGDTRVALRATAADTNDFFILTATQTSFGASLQDLFGVPGASDGFVATGLIQMRDDGYTLWGDAPQTFMLPTARTHDS